MLLQRVAIRTQSGLGMVARHPTTAKELAMEERLRKVLQPPITHCEVTDVSGGCGSFFKVKVVSPAFQGKSLVERNRLVYAALKDEIGEMHGLNVECSTG